MKKFILICLLMPLAVTARTPRQVDRAPRAAPVLATTATAVGGGAVAVRGGYDPELATVGRRGGQRAAAMGSVVGANAGLNRLHADMCARVPGVATRAMAGGGVCAPEVLEIEAQEIVAMPVALPETLVIEEEDFVVVPEIVGDEE